MFDWNDLRFFLAAARAGSLTRAAAATGASLSTVSRRIAALEEAVGASLFVRTPEGLSLTPAGQAVVEHAEGAETSAFAFEERLAELNAEPRGLVRVSLAGVDLLTFVLLPALPALLARHPDLQVEFESVQSLSDLVRREADIALRPVRPTTGEELVSRKARDEAFRVYASSAYLDRVGRDRPLGELEWIGGATEHDHLPQSVVQRRLSGGRYRLRCDSNDAQRQAVRAGLGCSVLSGTFGGLTPGLEVVPGSPDPAYVATLYLVCHGALRSVPRVAVVWEWLLDELANREGEHAILSERLAAIG